MVEEEEYKACRELEIITQDISYWGWIGCASSNNLKQSQLKNIDTEHRRAAAT